VFIAPPRSNPTRRRHNDEEITLPRLWIMSDLHLETVPHPEAFEPSRPEFDILVVAGDIWESDFQRGFTLLKSMAAGKPVIFVMGNHEPWNGVLGEEIELARLMAPQFGITLLEDEAVLVLGCLFIGMTLWTDYLLSNGAHPDANTGEQIDIGHEDGSHLITVGDAVTIHTASRGCLERLIAEADDSNLIVVVTHHAPHPLCVPHDLRDTWGSGNMASDLSYLTDSGRVSLWVHGHIHVNVDIERPGGTRIVCNPAGVRFSNPSFDESFVVTV
jgi:3',5'-cyclic AMP phosphodiesterase CpdA